MIWYNFSMPDDFLIHPDRLAAKPQVWEGMQSLYSWGPPPPPSFIRPDDLAELMAGLHPARA